MTAAMGALLPPGTAGGKGPGQCEGAGAGQGPIGGSGGAGEEEAHQACASSAARPSSFVLSKLPERQAALAEPGLALTGEEESAASQGVWRWNPGHMLAVSGSMPCHRVSRTRGGGQAGPPGMAGLLINCGRAPHVGWPRSPRRPGTRQRLRRRAMRVFGALVRAALVLRTEGADALSWGRGRRRHWPCQEVKACLVPPMLWPSTLPTGQAGTRRGLALGPGGSPCLSSTQLGARLRP